MSYHSTVTGVFKRELKPVKDVVEESSKDRAPGVLGALFLPSVRQARKEKITYEVILSIRHFSNSSRKRLRTNL